jgi:hypothetical protein
MARVKTRQAAVARPIGIYAQGIGTSFNQIFDVPDYSVPDPNKNWPQRDPDDDERRIQPGMVFLETPMLFYNSHTEAVDVEIRVFPEGASLGVSQGVFTVPPGDTYTHPLPGQRFVKADPTSSNGDSLQIRASVAGVVDVTCFGSIGSAEQDQPE